ncbi:MAG: dihydrolipoamide acetyltransferase family protein [Phycisphaerales bacterium]
MPIEITMPRLSDTMQQGTVVKWNVKEGDAVKAGDILADIETDKATMELESFDAGTVAALVAAEGANVPVGSVIAVLAGKNENAGEIKAKHASGGAAKSASSGAEPKRSANAASVSGADVSGGNGASSGTAVAEPPARETGGRVFASPLARKMAEDLGVDLGSVEGTGPSGRIVKADIEAAAKAGPTTARVAQPTVQPARGLATPVAAPPTIQADLAPLADKHVSLSNMRRTIAVRLVQSKTTIPHYQVTVGVDMDALLTLREQLNAQLSSQGVKLSVNDFLVRACALALHQHPHVNASWSEEKGGEAAIQLHGRVNIGVAIALDASKGGGLVVATLRDTDRMGLRSISQSTRAMAEKARTKGLTIDEQSDATFTISNLGMFDVEHFTAIINPPNAAILAVGAAIKQPVVRKIDGEDQIVIGHRMQMTMSSDHRIIDGAMAAAYLNTVKATLEAPATLLV